MTYTYFYICYSFRNLFVYFLSQHYFSCINSSPEDNGATLEWLNIALISILIELISFNRFGISYGSKLCRKFHTWGTRLHARPRARNFVRKGQRGMQPPPWCRRHIIQRLLKIGTQCVHVSLMLRSNAIDKIVSNTLRLFMTIK